MPRISHHAASHTAGNRRSKRPVASADLFAGAGGFSKAALNLGIRVKVAVEFDSHACATYRNNLAERNKIEVLEGDITQLPLEKIKSSFGDGGSCDLVLGGPPCQGFSVHRIKGAGVADPRNQLIHRYFEVVKHLKPKVFLLENVPGILWPRHKPYLDMFYKMAAEAGYRVEEPQVLDARDFGVPQRRKRVFIVGVRESLPALKNWPPLPTHGSAAHVAKDPRLLPWVPCRAAFDPAPAADVNDVHMRHGDELVEAFRKTPADGGSRRDSGRVLPCHKGHDGHKDVYGRIDRNQPAPTMTTACVNPSKGRFVHPISHHGITVRQAARLQTFPDDFVFEGGIMAAARQIGNAVPVGMGEAVLRPILNFIQGLPEEHD